MVFTVSVMEPDVVKGYVEDVMSLLMPVLLARVRSWERLDLGGSGAGGSGTEDHPALACREHSGRCVTGRSVYRVG